MSENHSGIGGHVSNECSCGGENGNCFHCYGTGIIRDRGRPAISSCGSNKPPKKSQALRTGPSPGIAAPKQSCSKCSFHGTPDQLKAHELQAHAAKKVDCPYCSFVGSESQLRDHQESCRASRALSTVPRRHFHKGAALYKCDACPFTGTRAMVKSHVQFDHRRPLIQSVCPVCQQRVKTNRLEKHVRKAHSLDTVPPLPAPAKLAAVGFHKINKQKKPVARRSELVTREDCRAEQKLDHTRPYAHAYREHGKFGSHPVHDGFDDESKP